MRMLFLLFLVSFTAFMLLSLSPVDPLTVNVGQAALGSMSPEQIEKLKWYWGVDVPPLERFAAWAADFLRGDMGISLLYRRPVSQILWERAGNSLALMAAAWLLSGVLGLTLGIAAGIRRGRWMDRIVSAYAILMASTPAFWLALLFLLLFAVKLSWFPIGLSVPIGTNAEEVTLWERIHHAVLPALTLALSGSSNIILHTREKVIEVMESDFILFARARGESKRRILFAHALRNLLLPALTLQFASISELFGGSVLVEQVFSYTGLGAAAVTAGLGSDLPLLLGITVVSAGMVFFGNLAADLLYLKIDPRMRQGRKKRQVVAEGFWDRKQETGLQKRK
ncbi:MAG: ABC transporter permease [bacterium]|nr:ABC transporter permease [bacterium]